MLSVVDKKLWLEHHGELIIPKDASHYTGALKLHRGNIYSTTRVNPISDLYSRVKHSLWLKCK